MAASNRIICLGLGSQTVRMAEMYADKNGGLVLHSYRSSELLADPAADATRIAQISIAVSEMVQAERLAGRDVNYSIPSQAVFTRFVKLPTVGAEKVEQIVEFEAQQNVPFPIDEVVWDYQLVTTTEPGKFEVVLVAIKADLLDELNDAVQGSGAKTLLVDVAPTAVYNAFRYNYAEVTGCSLILDIGAKTTNLIFVEDGKVFSRSIPIGGNTITAAIAKDFNEPFGKSEQRKKESGMVSLGGAYAEPSDPSVAMVAKIVRNAMTRLHAEISRSISFYKTQQGGGQPERVYLAGGAVGLPYMREFFSEKLGLPIEFFNPLRNVTVGPGVDLETLGREAHALGELVGLGLRQFNECPMELTLSPASVVSARAMSTRQPFFVLAALVFLLGLAGWWFYLFQASAVQSAVLGSITPKVSNLASVEKKFVAIQKQIQQSQSLAAPLAKVVEERAQWTRLVDDLNARLPDSFIWITSLEASVPQEKAESAPAARFGAAAPTAPKAKAAAPAKDPQQILIVKGLYLDNPRGPGVIDDFAKNLASSPFFTIDLNKKQEINPVRSTDINQWSLSYELRLPLTKPLPL